MLHEVRTQINDRLQQKRIRSQSFGCQACQWIDWYHLPARGQQAGNLHPVTMTAERMEGFSVKQVLKSPQAWSWERLLQQESAKYSHHPARAMHDTFYFENSILMPIMCYVPIPVRCTNSHDGKGNPPIHYHLSRTFIAWRRPNPLADVSSAGVCMLANQPILLS